jgi:lipopolysaccharide/colanic/teichoic acid biosynthesis glycosyltransferase
MIYREFLKRVFDFILACLAGVILLIPLMILAVIIKVKLGSPVFFVQERLGIEGNIFTLYKFRSMTDQTDKNGKLLSDEERLTRFGKKLRATSLDELPEIINILKGDMSFVGPRPLLIRYLTRYNKTQLRRMEVRPGLTGLAQVSGRNALSWNERFDLDIHYVDNYSFCMDVKIFIKTFAKVFDRSGISKEGHATMTEFMGSELEHKNEKEYNENKNN